MTGSSHAVFLSYASEDAQAAQRIAEALGASGIEVWFDKSELRGGDARDRRIRQQIHDCRLFIAVVSAHTEGRDEGYFRREWRLAVDRTHDMDERKAFLVPVVIDATSERGAHVPEKFHELQWTRLPGRETTPAFIERVKRLLSPENSHTQEPARIAGSTVGSSAPAPRGLMRRRMGVVSAAIAAAVLLALGYVMLERLNRSKPNVAGAASIAVLPLANESGEASQQYFSDGISEDLITTLSQFPGLKVIGRTSAFQLATEPLRANWYYWLAIYLSGLNRLDEAERAVLRALELQPGAAAYHERLAIIEIQLQAYCRNRGRNLSSGS